MNKATFLNDIIRIVAFLIFFWYNIRRLKEYGSYMANYAVFENEITVDASEFCVRDTLLCGQVFRFEPCGAGYRVFSKDKSAVVYELDGTAIIKTREPSYFAEYFDLERNYGDLRKLIPREGFLGDAAEYGKGIRILRQDCFETIISFIISANNNIKRIQAIISRLAQNAGEAINEGSAFPTVEALKDKDESFYAGLGCGYRSAYLAKTVPELANFDLEAIKRLPTCELKKQLLKFKGIGEKVASCIMLYGFQRWDVFPVDTWIFKVYKEHYSQGKGTAVSAERHFTERFGDLSGLIQQYMFHYRRMHINEKKDSGFYRR